MPKLHSPDPKRLALRKNGCLNSRATAVRDSLFAARDFFDARDLVQVKYEMLRRSSVDGEPISKSAKSFGFSRPSFYKARGDFETGGLPGLVPKKRGPRRAHKLDREIVEHLVQRLSEDPALTVGQLTQCVRDRFGITVHPRSVQRALVRREKNFAALRAPAEQRRQPRRGLRAAPPLRAR